MKTVMLYSVMLFGKSKHLKGGGIMTNKDVRRIFDKVYCIGYCALQSLLRFEKRVGYNCGIYGWNYDAYSLGDGICICTGYRNMPGKTIPYELVQKYEEKASDILSDGWGNGIKNKSGCRL